MSLPVDRPYTAHTPPVHRPYTVCTPVIHRLIGTPTCRANIQAYPDAVLKIPAKQDIAQWVGGFGKKLLLNLEKKSVHPPFNCL